MTERNLPQHQPANFAETIAGLPAGGVEIGHVDPEQIALTTSGIIDAIEQRTGSPYDVWSGTIQKTLLPMRGTEKGECAAFVVTEGSGVLEVVTGKGRRQEVLRQQAEPGTILLAHVDPNMAKTPWLRADTRNREPLKGYFIASQETRLTLADEANEALIMGARARRRAGESMQDIAEDKLRALGRLGTNS